MTRVLDDGGKVDDDVSRARAIHCVLVKKTLHEK
jgi:hypothetical protein